MKRFKIALCSLIALGGIVSFSNSVSADVETTPVTTSSVSIVPFGSKVIHYTKKSATLGGLTNTIIYNDGVYCGQLTLQSWSYEKDFSTGKMWYVGIYKGTVRDNGGCPIG
ncbi:hypothetical protein IGJ66_000471 [Enterococcus sp. DIV0176]|uniref:hypothetical protein n=1 Tax=Enterococcus sp. DIV0176 TaxID=2774758 RepID=UPI003D2FAB5B